MATIEVEGKRYRVVDYVDQAGMKVRVVDTPDGEKVAVLRNRAWTWWTAQERIGQSANAHALAEERSDDSQQRVVGGSES